MRVLIRTMNNGKIILLLFTLFTLLTLSQKIKNKIK
jgi:hypothetical protein